MMNAQIETVMTDLFSMNYFRFGQGKKTLVILPGLSLESVMNYADAVAESYNLLAEQFTIYVIDRRNELPAVYSIYDMARDTAMALQALGLEQADFFGASQGGMIAMVIAAKYPELVRKLVLGSTSACVSDAQYRVIESWIQLAKAGKATDLYLAFGEAIYPQEVFRQYQVLLSESAKNVTSEDLARFAILARSLKDFDAADHLRDITCPVLVLGSEDDHVLGAEAAVHLAEQLNIRPDSELFMYDGYGHAAYDTAPDYKARMLHFLAPELEDGF